MEYIQINTSQNVKIKLLQASIALRILAFFIDTLIKVAYLLLAIWLFDSIDISVASDAYSYFALFAIITSPAYFYTLFFESIMEGQTPGRRITKTKVVKIDGYQAHFSDYFIRWFFALVDFYFSSGVVAIISIIVSKKGQRLGGLASGTTVINLKNNISINQTIFENIENDYKVTYPNVLLLSDSDVQIIKTNLERALKQKDNTIINKLADKISSTIKTEPKQGTSSIDFIKIVLKDYNHLTGKE